MSYVEIEAADICNFLEEKGFTRGSQGNEVVYERAHNLNPNVKVKVYTSVHVHKTTARKCGGDSIKVCTIFDNGRSRFGVGKFPRIHRTGSTEAVLLRMYEKMRAAYARGTEWIREQEKKNGIPSRAPRVGGFANPNAPESSHNFELQELPGEYQDLEFEAQFAEMEDIVSSPDFYDWQEV